jgi:hypothetical protein
VLATAAFTDKLMAAGVFPLAGVTVRKLPPVLGTKDVVNGALVPAVVLVTWMLCAVGIDMDPASTVNEAVLAESVIADVAGVTLSVTGI